VLVTHGFTIEPLIGMISEQAETDYAWRS
jgi:hypothetical protein